MLHDEHRCQLPSANRQLPNSTSVVCKKKTEPLGGLFFLFCTVFAVVFVAVQCAAGRANEQLRDR
jgi:hypothetical protein